MSKGATQEGFRCYMHNSSGLYYSFLAPLRYAFDTLLIKAQKFGKDVISLLQTIQKALLVATVRKRS